MKTIDEMWGKIDIWISRIHNEGMRIDLSRFMYHHREKFVITPGSLKHHHAYESGLLVHTLEVIKLAYGMMKMLYHEFPNETIAFPDFSDEAIFCAMVHDVGKIVDYVYIPEMKRWTYNSLLTDHSKFCVKSWKSVIGDHLTEEMKHAILTHHGGWSKTGRDLNSVLAAVIHGADLISSRLERTKNE